jgi:hypothetical protein
MVENRIGFRRQPSAIEQGNHHTDDETTQVGHVGYLTRFAQSFRAEIDP